MTTSLPPCLNPNWRTFYRAAILETDRSVQPQRVSQAEEAVKSRGREIFFYADDTAEEEEQEALEDALYALRAFRSAWQHPEAA
jgi:hypothetical protein